MTSVKKQADELNIAIADHARDLNDVIAAIEDEAAARITESRENWDAFLAEINAHSNKMISEQTSHKNELVKHLKALVSRYNEDGMGASADGTD